MEYESFVSIPIPMCRADWGSLILFPTAIELVSQLSMPSVPQERNLVLIEVHYISWLEKNQYTHTKEKHLLSIENEFYGRFFFFYMTTVNEWCTYIS